MFGYCELCIGRWNQAMNDAYAFLEGDQSVYVATDGDSEYDGASLCGSTSLTTGFKLDEVETFPFLD